MSKPKLEIGDRVKLKPICDSFIRGKIIQKRILFTIELDKADLYGHKSYVAYDSEVEPE